MSKTKKLFENVWHGYPWVTYGYPGKALLLSWRDLKICMKKVFYIYLKYYNSITIGGSLSLIFEINFWNLSAARGVKV